MTSHNQSDPSFRIVPIIRPLALTRYETMPEECQGTRPSRDECEQAIGETFRLLIDGMSRDDAREGTAGYWQVAPWGIRKGTQKAYD